MKFAIVALSLFLAPSAHAAPALEDLNALNQQLAQASDGQAVALDPRLRLEKCPATALFDRSANGYIAVRCAALGWRLRVPLLRSQDLIIAATPIVKRGDLVEITYEGDDFDATAPATALESGAAGQIIRVKTSPANVTIAVTVVHSGEVRLSR
jgi:flagellar basal body P-ring formation protein FlgA